MKIICLHKERTAYQMQGPFGANVLSFPFKITCTSAFSINSNINTQGRYKFCITYKIKNKTEIEANKKCYIKWVSIKKNIYLYINFYPKSWFLH